MSLIKAILDFIETIFCLFLLLMMLPIIAILAIGFVIISIPFFIMALIWNVIDNLTS